MKPFEQVVADHGPAVLRVCRALLRSHDAEDAWSETFLAAMRAYPDLPPGSNLEAWLVTIAKRKAIDHHRARAHAPVPVAELPESSTAPSPRSSDLDLGDALARLTPLQREAVVYHHIGGVPYSQVAEILGNSEAAARRAAADGIKRLRSMYEGERR